MEIGASSACFYPLETEKAFREIAELGFSHCEIFFNAFSELKPAFIKELKAIRDAYGIEVVSLHPYGSFGEGYAFFSGYKRRFDDGVEDYKRYFDAAGVLGAKYIVMHGAARLYDIDMELYAERFGTLNEVARANGCVVAHENVVNFLSATPEFTAFMKKQLGDSYKMVLDVKQARRAGVRAEDFIDIMGNNIVHVHLSDCNSKMDCIAPCEEGHYDFGKVFTELDKVGYNGKYIVELYSDGYEKKEQLVKSAEYLGGILEKVRREAYDR